MNTPHDTTTTTPPDPGPAPRTARTRRRALTTATATALPLTAAALATTHPWNRQDHTAPPPALLCGTFTQDLLTHLLGAGPYTPLPTTNAPTHDLSTATEQDYASCRLRQAGTPTTVQVTLSHYPLSDLTDPLQAGTPELLLDPSAGQSMIMRNADTSAAFLTRPDGTTLTAYLDHAQIPNPPAAAQQLLRTLDAAVPGSTTTTTPAPAPVQELTTGGGGNDAGVRALLDQALTNP